MKKTFKFYLEKEELKIIVLKKEKFAISIIFSVGKNSVLTTVSITEEKEDVISKNFAKLKINFEERFYSRNKIPNNTNRRENKSNYEYITISRMIDRSLRSFFIKEFNDFVNINNYVLSIDEKNEYDPKIISIWNSFLCCFLLEKLFFFDKPIGITKLNKLEEEILLNKINQIYKGSSLELIIASDIKKNIIFLDLIAKEINNKEIKRFINIAHKKNVKLIKIFSKIFKKLEIKKNYNKKEEKNEYEEYKRTDKRKLKEIRKIEIIKNFLPVNSNALFARGDTKSISVVTLGKINEGLKNSNLLFEREDDHFIHHYNFLPQKSKKMNMNSISRREIGHGKLIERSFFFVIPKIDDFPYTIRAVSEIISSDGSSSQASICSTSLALLIAKVPILRPVVGISFGLINNRIIWDINEIEDEIGIMDLKISGTEKGITSMQLDTKEGGINLNKIKECLIDSKKINKYLLKKIKKEFIKK